MTPEHPLNGGAFSDNPQVRFESISESVASGDLLAAVAGAKTELHFSAVRGGPGALASIADLFHNAGIHAVAFELYTAFLARAAKDDARRPEVEYRAGVMAAKHLRLYDAGLDLLSDAARTHSDSARVDSAGRLIAEMKARLAPSAVAPDANLPSGPCTVVRKTAHQIDVSSAGKIVARITRQPLAEATRTLHASPGFVAVDVPPETANNLLAELARIGVATLVIPSDKLVALPVAKELRQIAVARNGMECIERGAQVQPVKRDWSRIFYICAAVVAMETGVPRAPDVNVVPYSPGWSTYQADYTFGRWAADEIRRSQKKTEERTIIDIFALDPYECLRCVVGETRFAVRDQGGKETTNLNPGRFAQALAVYAAAVPANEGVVLLALDMPAPRWKELTFDSIAEFDRYNYWRLQLEQYA